MRVDWQTAKKNLLELVGTYPNMLDNALDSAYVAGIDDTRETVICAAIRMPDGYIVRGHRHSDAMRTASGIERYKDDRPYSGDQGFVTSFNRYVGRVEGCQLQKAAGIKSILAGAEGYLHGELYSEDLY